jgi:hypothetical protein
MLHVGSDLGERDVVPLLVQTKPRLTVGPVEDGVADTTGQPVDGDRIARQPPDRRGAAGNEQDDERRRQPVPEISWSRKSQ